MKFTYDGMNVIMSFLGAESVCLATTTMYLLSIAIRTLIDESTLARYFREGLAAIPCGIKGGSHKG